jgi:hypothetical protein
MGFAVTGEEEEVSALGEEVPEEGGFKSNFK